MIANLRLPATFRAFRHRNYLLWFVGQGISLIGTWMQTMAQQVLVYRLTGSAASLGIISFIGLIPLIPLSLWGGSITDRFPRRSILLVTQSIMLLQAFLLAWLTWTGTVQIWQVYLLAFILGAAISVDLPARQAFTVDMVEGKEDLTSAIGMNSAMFNGARAIGPALAGILVATTGEANAFFFNGLTFIAVLISLLLMRSLPLPHPMPDSESSALKHMAGGIKFIMQRQTILVLVSLIAVSAFLSMPYNTLLPVFASDVLAGSAQGVINAICGSRLYAMGCQAPEALPLGLLYTMIGVGAVVGALIVASLPSKARRGLLLTLGNLAFPFFLLLFAFSKNFALSMVLMLFIGFSFVWQNALANTLLQFVTPDELRGRVMGVYSMTFQAMFRLGGLQAGLVADWLSASISVAIGAAVSLIYGIFVAIRFPKLRDL
ncbi:MAG: MFS transporter [Anaerolineales bacterium]|nr:MAG: MFS transporter [Anaerolineales bacterium]